MTPQVPGAPADHAKRERRYAMTRIGPGDYLLPSNDTQTIWRLWRYTDGPSFGLDDWSRDRELWSLWRWTGATGPGSFIDTSVDSTRWEEVATMLPTRRKAIDIALGS